MTSAPAEQPRSQGAERAAADGFTSPFTSPWISTVPDRPREGTSGNDERPEPTGEATCQPQ